MTKNFLLSFFFLAFANNLIAQNPLVKQWDYRYGGTKTDELNKIIATSDGGILLAGSSYSDSTGDKSQQNWDTSSVQNSNDFWIVKLDSSGNKQWDKRYGGRGYDWLRSVIQLNDDGYIIGGIARGDSGGDISQINRGGQDYWIIRIDSIGNKIWDQRYGGDDFELFSSMLQTDDGYLIGGSSISGVSGEKSQPSWGGYDYWIFKVDSFGNKQWDKRFGGDKDDNLYSMVRTNDNGYILAGNSYSSISGDKTQPNWDINLNSNDYWILKIDSMGNKQWDKRFGGLLNEVLLSVVTTTNDGYLLGGISLSGISGDKMIANHDTAGTGVDFWLVKVDLSGNKVWEKTYGGYNMEDEFSSIIKTADCGYLIAGTSYSDSSGDKTEYNLGKEQTWVVKLDSIGNKQWDKTLHTNVAPYDDEFGYAIQLNDYSYVLGNYTSGGIGGDKTQSSQGGLDYWIVKYIDTTFVACNISLGMDNPSLDSQISIYPNPFDDQLHVSVSNNEPAEVVLYDMLSRKLLQQEFTNSVSLNTSQLAKGIYICEVRNNKGVVKKCKMVKD